mgnify:CR=1 FL=1
MHVLELVGFGELKALHKPVRGCFYAPNLDAIDYVAILLL